MHARLTIFRGELPAHQITMERGKAYYIGRSTKCNIAVDDAELSRQHAVVLFTENQWLIKDNNSKNGVVIAGQKVDSAHLRDGTWINVGSLLIRFEILSDVQQKRSIERVEELHRLTMEGERKIKQSVGVEQALRHLLTSVLSVSSTQRGFALLTQADGELEVACCHGVECAELVENEFYGSRGAVQAAISSRKAVVTSNAQDHATLSARESVIASRTKALVCLPLTVLQRVVGVIYAESTDPGKLFTRLDVQLLEELGQHAALIIAAAQLGSELDGIDRHLSPSAMTLNHLQSVQHRIPHIKQPIEGRPVIPMTGIRWQQPPSHL